MDMKLVNAQRKVQILHKYLRDEMSVLDFGCGDLTFAKELHRVMPALKVTGIDVTDFGNRPKGIVFKKYAGKKLPYKKNMFDVVISYHVLHHTNNPLGLFSECMRVCGKTLLLVEPVPRFPFEIIGMTIMDWIFNAWKSKTISMTYAFKNDMVWKREIENNGFKLQKRIDVELLPIWLPTGRSYLYVCTKGKI